MRYQAVDEIRTRATVTEPMSRRARLRRWADLLMGLGPRPLQAFQGIEFYAEPQRRALRRPGSPLSVAVGDPVLRAAGLTGDSLGEAQDFFGLSDSELHRVVCDCHWLGEMTGERAGRRVAALARPSFGARLARAFGFG